MSSSTITDSQAERRAWPRFFFSPQQQAGVRLSIAGKEPQIVVALLNLSAGGMATTVLRQTLPMPELGETVTIHEFLGLPELMMTEPIMAAVKGIYAYPNFQHSVYGFEFIKINDNLRHAIAAFVAAHMPKKVR